MSNLSKTTPQGTTSSEPTSRDKLTFLKKEGFYKDLYYGVIDSRRVELVAFVEGIVKYIFMQTLHFPTDDDEEINQLLIKGQLLLGLRSFCSALRTCENVCNCVNVCEDNLHHFSHKTITNEVKESATNQEFCRNAEERVKVWMKGINVNILMESEQLRRENDSSGPQDELEYWKCREVQFSQLLSHLQAKFIQSIERCGLALYLDDPVRLEGLFLNLFLNEALDEAMNSFGKTKKEVMFKKSEYLDHSNEDFIVDFECFL
ncbi:hypothetical protein DMENIID0001_130030 [Sergentomyia squamirostris]